MPRFVLIIVALTVIAAIGVTHAQSSKLVDRNRYKWRDAQGNLHYDDALPPAAVQFGYEVVNSQGIVVKRIERAKTPQEIAAAKAAAVRERAERQAANAKAVEDQRLISVYTTEDELQRAQKQQLDVLDQQIDSTKVSLRNQEQGLADMLSRAAEAEGEGKTLPDAQAKQLARLNKDVETQRQALARQETARIDAARRFEQELARYRELKAQEKSKDAAGMN